MFYNIGSPIFFLEEEGFQPLKSFWFSFPQNSGEQKVRGNNIILKRQIILYTFFKACSYSIFKLL